MESQYCW